MKSRSRWWYLSFSGSRGWQGGAVVQADDRTDAIAVARRLGAHPGGEVQSTELIPMTEPPARLVGRLIRDRGELDQLCGAWIVEDEAIRDRN